MSFLEGYVDGEQDPLLKQFKRLYVNALCARAICHVALEHAWVDGQKEENLSRSKVCTPEVIKEAATINKDDGGDDEAYRQTNRF